MTVASADSGEFGDPLRAAADTMRAVRERCVWTQQIDHRALVPYLIEESAELVDAVEEGTRAELREELGDLLWQVLFHAEIASRDTEDPFDIDDVARGLTRKMVRRHPHVFAGGVAETPEQVLVLWNAAKAAEKHERRSVLDGVSTRMPSLALAQKLLARASQLPPLSLSLTLTPPPRPTTSAETHRVREGFDAEGASRAPGGTPGRAPGGAPGETAGSERALGDALLALVEQARANGWDAERALRERLRVLETDIRAAEEAGGGAR